MHIERFVESTYSLLQHNSFVRFIIRVLARYFQKPTIGNSYDDNDNHRSASEKKIIATDFMRYLSRRVESSLIYIFFFAFAPHSTEHGLTYCIVHERNEW